MAKSREMGMQTFDQHLFDLYDDGHISYEDALRNADSQNELRMRIKLEGKADRGRNPLEDAAALNAKCKEAFAKCGPAPRLRAGRNRPRVARRRERWHRWG